MEWNIKGTGTPDKCWRHRTWKPKARLFALLGLSHVELKFKYWPLMPLNDPDQTEPSLPTFLSSPS